MHWMVEIRLDNAAEFSPAASPVDIEVRGEGDHMLLRVVDRGVGLTPDELPFSFER